MLFLGIDQHSKQITVCLRNQQGEIILRRQVSTRPGKVREFFETMTAIDAEFAAIVEVCGFNDWLLSMLREFKCRDIVLIQPEKQDKRKTDPRDANKLCETLWINWERLRDGRRPNGMRRVYIPSTQEQENREMTATRKQLGKMLTKTLNRIHRTLHRHNLMREYPTKTFQTKRGRQWLASVPLPAVDRLEMDLLLKQWELWEEQIQKVDEKIMERAQQRHPGEIQNDVELLQSIPGISYYSGLSLVSRIGSIDRFPRPRSLANYFGLTPGCRNSGNKQQRLGAITKQGSAIARFHLGQVVVHVLRRDRTTRDWYRKIKARRGAKIARVAVMRRITTCIWHVLKHREPYSCGGPPSRLRKSTEPSVA